MDSGCIAIEETHSDATTLMAGVSLELVHRSSQRIVYHTHLRRITLCIQ